MSSGIDTYLFVKRMVKKIKRRIFREVDLKIKIKINLKFYLGGSAECEQLSPHQNVCKID